MIQVDDPVIQEKIKQVYHYQQDHIFLFWDRLDDKGKQNLLKQISGIDFTLLQHFIQISQAAKTTEEIQLKPPHVISLEDRKTKDTESLQVGEVHLRNGKMAAFLVAGGQGTRLGFDGPKGMCPVTPVRKKTLFQLHAEKILATSRRYDVTIPWYIMTSQTNNDQTKEFFEQNNYFGLRKADVFFLMQEMVPAIDRHGKLILDQMDHLFMNPNGHGGSLKALWDSGAISDMQDRGIETIFYFQVDNVLTKICDPVYIGYHVSCRSEMSNKVVRKLNAEEKMGILCMINDRFGLVEYSDISDEDMHATDKNGNLKFWTGNIATHIMELSFVIRENYGGFHLPYHIAEKSIPYLSEDRRLIHPEEKNGLKFETFVFDALPDAERTVSIEVDRSKEFSVLKNKEGTNSPATVKRDLIYAYTSWLEQAGYVLKKDVPQRIEISPLLALSSDDLQYKNLNINPDADEIYLD
jgi:UDP-N-acetylglucosamine/UDP-N-acetylgalactosamine diphosphorylase